MKNEKLNITATTFIIVWLVTLLFLIITSFFVATHLLDGLLLFIPLTVLAIVAYDTFQNKHALRKNYPLIGRLRYLFESVRPELRQYFFEGELDGKPFNRRQRS